ncbi:hypothetical protein, partial [Nocardioides sp.]|uniref:hypothetical protein n=1 Tax=Nocardioides sp. TaxID=35761 RepID=UPI0027357070
MAAVGRFGAVHKETGEPHAGGPPGSTGNPYPPLSQTEAKFCQEWIANDRQLRAFVTQMREVAAMATELIRNEATNQGGQGSIACYAR